MSSKVSSVFLQVAPFGTADLYHSVESGKLNNIEYLRGRLLDHQIFRTFKVGRELPHLSILD